MKEDWHAQRPYWGFALKKQEHMKRPCCINKKALTYLQNYTILQGLPLPMRTWVVSMKTWKIFQKHPRILKWHIYL